MQLTWTTTAAATGVVVLRSAGDICRGSEPAEHERAFRAACTKAAAANVGTVPPSIVSTASNPISVRGHRHTLSPLKKEGQDAM